MSPRPALDLPRYEDRQDWLQRWEHSRQPPLGGALFGSTSTKPDTLVGPAEAVKLKPAPAPKTPELAVKVMT